MPTASPFALTPEVTAIVAGAFDTGNVLLLAAVDKDQKPVLSFRGSTAVFSDSQLSFWARNAEGGTIEAIKDNPHVAFMYRSQSVPLLRSSDAPGSLIIRQSAIASLISPLRRSAQAILSEMGTP
ncbi:MAG: hypothetical protein QOD93_3173 [Acetobacteraceae bacterium]|jgi:hypothetical protein|nr:hypothetical protein [Acetobacteraceae bacterium]